MDGASDQTIETETRQTFIRICFDKMPKLSPYAWKKNLHSRLLLHCF